MKQAVLLATALLFGHASQAQFTRTFTGALTATDPTIPGNRLTRDNTASSCASPKAFPGTPLGNDTGVRYDAYTFQARNATCVTTTLVQNCSQTASARTFGSIYSGSFNPADLSQNYKADMGISQGNGLGVTASFTLAANETGVFVVSGVSTTDVCSAYTVTLTSSAPLPVELVSFTAQAQDHAVQLDWAMASETTNAYFAIERSLDGRTFEQVGQVAGHGRSTQPRQYQYTDAAPVRAALGYYRLRQVDTDGTSAYSPVRTVAYKTETLGFFPNPTTGLTSFSSPVATTLTVRNALGSPVQLVHLAAGTQLVDLHALPTGVYTLTDEVTYRTTRLVRAAE
jgi:hypothetical protein